ncbi:D-tyrosyl-tRNA(Tyr) deacylase [Homalodisca vitripennis]|nr:D-tyrosyl-tRNA(Tyr) deacylase [Homalodisca vitripennis]
MRAVIQRVSSARVEVEGNTVAAIGLGLCVFLGIHINDTQRDIEYVARKIVNIRLFDTDSGARVSVKARGYEVLCRSQITLCSTIQGFKISYHQAMSPESAKSLYQTFLETIRKEYCPEKVKGVTFT